MVLDLRTLLLTCALINIVMIVYLLLLLISYRKEYRGIVQFISGLSLIILGNIGISFDDIFGKIISLVIGNSLFVLGAVMIYVSLLLFFNHKTGKLYFIMLGLIPLAAVIEQIIFGIVTPDLKVRIISISFLILLPTFLITWLLIKYRNQTSLPGILLIANSAANVLILLLRIIVTLASNISGSLFSAGPLNTLTVLFWTLTTNVWPFGFSLLISYWHQEKEIKLGRENAVLLRELYHRTKNNMQVVSAFLQLQRKFTKSAETKKQLQAAENRIRTISLVHEKLYQSKNLSSISLEEYIRELTGLIMESYCIDSNKIRLNLIVENISVLIDIAVPIGLVINELLSNIFKHAFPENKGKISIKINRKDNDIISLKVNDDGIGVPKDFDYYNVNTLGLQTIINIVKNQLLGKIKFESGKGFGCSIEFVNTIYNERV